MEERLVAEDIVNKIGREKRLVAEVRNFRNRPWKCCEGSVGVGQRIVLLLRLSRLS